MNKQDEQSYRDLQAKYDALLSRIKHFFGIEQKLIDTGYRLEAERARFEAIYGYNQQLIAIDELAEFASVTASAVTDIFDVEGGALWLFGNDSRLPSLPTATELDNNIDIQWLQLGEWLSSQQATTLEMQVTDIISIDVPHEPVAGLSRLLAARLYGRSSEPIGFLLAMVSTTGSHLYDTPTDEFYGSFNVFAQQVAMLLQNRHDQQTIKRHVEALNHSEAQLVAARDDAEAANRTKSIFLANMSHEIRTPMNGVLGMTEMLKNSRGLDTRQHRHADMAYRSAQSLLGVINNILDVSKIEAGYMRAHKDDFDLSIVLEDCISIIEKLAQDVGLPLQASIDPALPVKVSGDATKLRQVLLNLLGNAVKYTDKGSVSLIAKLVDADDSQYRIVFEVRDTGPGIEPDRHQAIFEPFTQADNSSRRAHDGTGLGLTIARQLVNLMGGELEMTSVPGHGTTFTMCLPFGHADAHSADSAHPAPQQATDPVYDTNEKQVLLVEDNMVNQEVAIGFLEDLGYRVTACNNGKDGLQAYGKYVFDYILMDCHMPGIDGFETAREIRKLEQKEQRKRVAMIALTADVEKGIVNRCLSAGMDDYLSKPLLFESLQSALEKWK